MNDLRVRYTLVNVLLMLVLASCGQSAKMQANAHVATSTVSAPTPEPTVAQGVQLDGKSVAGQTRAQLQKALAVVALPPRVIIAQTGELSHTLTFKALTVDADATINAVLSAPAQSAVTTVVRFDNAEIQQQIASLNTVVTSTSGVTLQTSDDPFNSQFMLDTPQQIDTKVAESKIFEALATEALTVTIPVQPGTIPVLPTPAQLQDAIDTMAKAWPGIVGIYVYNLDTNEVVAKYNENTVFSGASVMKVPILIHAFANVSAFDDDQTSWMRDMIINSDNLAANKMLATSVSGQGTESAYLGAQDMNTMLTSLGLEHTYQTMPYEAREYLIGVLNYKIKLGPKQEGPAPYTDADPVLRTTPAEMSKVFIELYRCSQGSGELLKIFPQTLNADRCGQMLDLMHENADYSRMMSGLPDTAYVSHKSGWIEDMQSDVGVITTPNKQHVVMAIYVYRDLTENGGDLQDDVAGPVIGGFAKLIYSAFVPAGTK